MRGKQLQAIRHIETLIVRLEQSHLTYGQFANLVAKDVAGGYSDCKILIELYSFGACAILQECEKARAPRQVKTIVFLELT